MKNLLKNKFKIVDKYTIIRSFFVARAHPLFVLLFFFLCLSCSDWAPKKEMVVARVGNVYLYASDISLEGETYEDKNDSLFKVRNYIDAWAKTQILVQLAERNLPDDKMKTHENLINQYRLELYTNAYIQSVVNSILESEITSQEIDSVLSLNEEVFKLNAPLYLARYIHLPPDNVDEKEIQNSFERFTDTDQEFLDSLSFQYINYKLSDSIWSSKRDLFSSLSFLNEENAVKYLKKSQFFRVEDSLGVYLFFVKNYLEKGETPPRIILEPTIKSIIRNQRKLKFTKQFEKDIIKDAIKSKTYEIY